MENFHIPLSYAKAVIADDKSFFKKPKFFKVFIVRDENRIIIRDCFRIDDRYAYLRPLRSAGTEMPIAHCLAMTDDKYFISLSDAENFIIDRREKRIKILEAEIKSKTMAIELIKNNIKEYKTEEYTDYDDRCNYERYF